MEATLDHAFIVININCVCSILLPNGTHSLSSTTWKSQYVWMFLLKKMNYCRCNVPITTKLQLAPRPHFRWENENTVDAPESPQQSIEFQTCQSVFISTLWGILLCTLNISAAMTQKKKIQTMHEFSLASHFLCKLYISEYGRKKESNITKTMIWCKSCLKRTCAV